MFIKKKERNPLKLRGSRNLGFSLPIVWNLNHYLKTRT